MFQFTGNQMSIPHNNANVKKSSLLIQVVLEAVLVSSVATDNTAGFQSAKSLCLRKCTCNIHR
jgi:hypothetical protein